MLETIQRWVVKGYKFIISWENLTLYLCDFIFSADFFFRPSVLSFIYPCSLYIYAAFVNPRPSTRYWFVRVLVLVSITLCIAGG